MSHLSTQDVPCSVDHDQEDAHNVYLSYVKSDSLTCPIAKQTYVDGNPITMELDTGAARSYISQSTYYSLLKHSRPALPLSSTLLHTYGGFSLPVHGEICVQVSLAPIYPSKSTKLIVVKGSGLSLMVET